MLLQSSTRSLEVSELGAIIVEYGTASRAADE